MGNWWGMETDDKPINPFRIDDGDLWAEWVRQPGLTRRAGRIEADAKHEYAQAKTRYEIAEADARRAVRNSPAKYNLKDKPTEAMVSEVVLAMPDIQEHLTNLNALKRDVDYAGTDVNAMIDRRKALERLVELKAMDYHAEREPRALSPATRAAANDVTKDAARKPVKPK